MDKSFVEGLWEVIDYLRDKLAAAEARIESGNQALMERDRAMRNEIERLATSKESERRITRFAAEVIEGHTGTWEGCDIEEMAIKAGLMTLVEVTEPCCEGCACASVDNIPGTCYRPTEQIRAALKERDSEAQG